MADMGVIVLSTGVVVGKEVYSGDVSNLTTSLNKRKTNDPSLTFSVLDLSNSADQGTFNSTTVFSDTPAQVLAKVRTQAGAEVITGLDATSELQRAVLLTILDQLNTIRAALPTPLPPITPTQAKTAVQNKLNSGAAD